MIHIAIAGAAGRMGRTLIEACARAEGMRLAAAIEHPEPGEVVFVDEAGLVSARRWCWRQSAESAARPDTTEVLVTIEGHHDGARADVAAALEDLLGFFAEHCPAASVRHGLLSADAPAF